MISSPPGNLAGEFDAWGLDHKTHWADSALGPRRDQRMHSRERKGKTWWQGFLLLLQIKEDRPRDRFYHTPGEQVLGPLLLPGLAPLWC